MKPITAEILVKCKASPEHAQSRVEPLNRYLAQYEINTPLRLAHFLATCIHESAGYSRVVESLNYSAERLMKVWPRRFTTLAFARLYAGNPVKLANYVYGSRLGNGPAQSGDGWAYIGRGDIMTTGFDNYARLTKLFGINYVDFPHLLERPDDAVRAACQFWKDRNLNALADADDSIGVRKTVNGGTVGLAECQQLTLICKGQVAQLFA